MTIFSAKKILLGLTATLIVSTFASGFLVPDAAAALKTPDDKYARIANHYMRAGTDITPDKYPLLAKYDLLVFPAEAQNFNSEMFAQLRKLNPHIIILAYVPTKSWNDVYWTDALHAKLRAGIQDAWWLRDSKGQSISVWSGTRMLNAISGWSEWLPQYVHDDVMSSGAWDGVFYDEFSANISWVNGGDLDTNNDGIRDDATLVDVGWKRSMTNMLKKTRELLGPDAVIVTNGDSTPDLQPYVNGRMFESFPTPWEAGGTWRGVMANYLNLHRQVGYPPVFMINSNAGNKDNPADYRAMRYGLTSTLMGDGFFCFDYGEQDHGQLWYYDEYDARLGKPLNKPINVLNLANRNIVAGVWRRDFQNGVVLVNSTSEPRTVNFGQELEHLHGSQAPDVNDGSVTQSVTLPPNDGVILLKRVSEITGSAFPNGAYARFFDTQGSKVRNGFFAYESGFDGNSMIIIKDVDGDGALEKIAAGKTSVTVTGADGKLRSKFDPYGPAYASGVEIAAGDLDGNGKDELVTGTGEGGGPQIRVFNLDGRALSPGFFAFEAASRGGVHVAVADVLGNGKPAIVAGAGKGGSPTVKVFTSAGRLITSFLAYGIGYRGGVRVAAGDLQGDGKNEIVTGSAPGGGPHVRVFSGSGKSFGKGFFAGDPSTRNGVNVAVTDVNNDGKAEIVALTTDVFQMSSY